MSHRVRVVTQEPTESGAYELCMIPKWIDWNDSSDRKWLKNHTHWAMMNNKLVMLIPNPTCTHLKGDSDVHESN